MLHLRVLGPLAADFSGEPIDLGGPRQRAVLALLLVARGGALSADRMIDRLWRGNPPSRAIASLQAYVSKLRRLLEPDRPHRGPAKVLVSVGPGYALRLPDDAVDAWRFEAELRRAQSAPPDKARRLLSEALGRWQGPAYAEVADEEWAVAEAYRISELHLAASELLVDATLRSGHAQEAVPAADALTREHPLREEGWRLLALALWASGRQADALTALRRSRGRLLDELGLDPSPALVELEAAILGQRMEVLHAVVPPRPSARRYTPDPYAGQSTGAVRMTAHPTPFPAPHATPSSSAVPDPLPAPDPQPATGPGPGARPTPVRLTSRPGDDAPAAAHTTIGREADLARIAELLPPRPEAPHALAVLADPGVGKSALLDAAAGLARARGLRVLRARGTENERELAFAGLHQLLRTALKTADELPARQRDALLAAFGLAGDPEPAERLQVSLAALTLLSQLADHGPLLLIVDDAHWVDPASLDVLGFVARRLAGEPIGLLLGARGTLAPHAFDRDVPLLPLRPLQPTAADELLDLQPTPPQGEARRQVLALADGNPLALVELSKAVAQDHGPKWRTESIPLTERLERVFTAQLDELPEAGRQALLLAAASGSSELATLPAPATEPAAWLPVERAGLVRLTDGEIHFRHPLVRSAVYHAAPFARRREAHLALAEHPGGSADRRAWHLAAAAVSADESVAQALEETADRALRRSAGIEVVTTLERAAQLSPDPPEQARRYARAAFVATYLDHPERIADLAAKVAARTDDPGLLAQASLVRGWAAFAANRQTEAVSLLLPTAEALVNVAPDAALNAVAMAAAAAYHSADPHLGERVLRMAQRLPAGDEAGLIWVHGVCDVMGRRPQQLAALRAAARQPEGSMERVWRLAGVASVFDQNELVRELLAESAQLWSDVAGSSVLALIALGWAHFLTGRWADARALSERLLEGVTEATPPVSAAHALTFGAALVAVRGETGMAREMAGRVLTACEPDGPGYVSVRAWTALGTAAVADGSAKEAYRWFRLLFDDDGEPLHHVSGYGIAELAHTARQSGHEEEARQILWRTERRHSGALSPRMAQLLARARALLSAPADAEAHFREALGEPDPDKPLFEQAQTRLDYARWLLRRDRTAEAEAQLVAALEVFEAAGARPWAVRTRTLLRGAGVRLDPAPGSAIGGLSTREQQIVQCVAQGLGDDAIAERLLLSRRSVTFHLDRALAKLGITAREELRGFVDTDTGEGAAARA